MPFVFVFAIIQSGMDVAVNIISGSDGANGGIPGAGIYEADQVITMMIIGDHWMNIITDVFQFKAPSYY